MLPSIGIVFPCKYCILMGLIIILLLLPNETVITTGSRLQTINGDVIKAMQVA